MKTIAALVDFSDTASEVLDLTAGQAHVFDARVVLMHVVTKKAAGIGFDVMQPLAWGVSTAQGMKTDSERMEAFRDSLIRRGVNVLMERFPVGTVERLLEECRAWKADLIVVSHHHCTVYNWTVGTYTNVVLETACCPFLVVPAENKALQRSARTELGVLCSR